MYLRPLSFWSGRGREGLLPIYHLFTQKPFFSIIVPSFRTLQFFYFSSFFLFFHSLPPSLPPAPLFVWPLMYKIPFPKLFPQKFLSFHEKYCKWDKHRLCGRARTALRAQELAMAIDNPQAKLSRACDRSSQWGSEQFCPANPTSSTYSQRWLTKRWTGVFIGIVFQEERSCLTYITPNESR